MLSYIFSKPHWLHHNNCIFKLIFNLINAAIMCFLKNIVEFKFTVYLLLINLFIYLIYLIILFNILFNYFI